MLFPAHAGMNRWKRDPNIGLISVPRTRGDEPPTDTLTLATMRCSPHTRG